MARSQWPSGHWLVIYQPHGPEEPLSLQDHNQVARYRNIWIRRLKGYDQQ